MLDLINTASPIALQAGVKAVRFASHLGSEFANFLGDAQAVAAQASGTPSTAMEKLGELSAQLRSAIAKLGIQGPYELSLTLSGSGEFETSFRDASSPGEAWSQQQLADSSEVSDILDQLRKTAVELEEQYDIGARQGLVLTVDEQQHRMQLGA